MRHSVPMLFPFVATILKLSDLEKNFHPCVAFLPAITAADGSSHVAQVGNWVARFFSVKVTKTGKNIPNDHKMYQMAVKYTYHLAVK
jgi:hypothetical protein